MSKKLKSAEPKEQDLGRVEVDGASFLLLNPGKVKAALEFMAENKLAETSENLLAFYDRLGGAIKLESKDGNRAVALGAFFDFENKEPRKGVDYANLGDENFSDELVVVRKKVAKKPDPTPTNTRLKKLSNAAKSGKKARKEEEGKDGESEE